MQFSNKSKFHVVCKNGFYLGYLGTPLTVLTLLALLIQYEQFLQKNQESSSDGIRPVYKNLFLEFL